MQLLVPSRLAAWAIVPCLLMLNAMIVIAHFLQHSCLRRCRHLGQILSCFRMCTLTLHPCHWGLGEIHASPFAYWRLAILLICFCMSACSANWSSMRNSAATYRRLGGPTSRALPSSLGILVPCLPATAILCLPWASLPQMRIPSSKPLHFLAYRNHVLFCIHSPLNPERMLSNHPNRAANSLPYPLRRMAIPSHRIQPQACMLLLCKAMMPVCLHLPILQSGLSGCLACPPQVARLVISPCQLLQLCMHPLLLPHRLYMPCSPLEIQHNLSL